MTKYLEGYRKEIEEILENDESKVNWKKVLERHRVVIGFLQHERLIHLMVTLAFGLAFLILMSATLIYKNDDLIIPDLLLFVLLVPYIFHYFVLENGVQRMYQLDKEIEEKI